MATGTRVGMSAPPVAQDLPEDKAPEGAAPSGRDRLRSALESVRVPLTAFFATRALLALLAWAGSIWLPYSGNHGRMVPKNLLLDALVRDDAGWYLRIASNGYSGKPSPLGERDLVFFPLYPLLVRGATYVTRNIHWSSVVVSNLALLAAVILLHRLARERFEERVADASVWLLLCYPYSFFLSAAYTEATFLFCVVLAFFAAEHKRWWLAAVGVALASATKTVGILALPAIALVYLQKAHWKPRNIRLDALWLLLGTAGLGLYMLFLWKKFGSPWLFTASLAVPGWGKEMTLKHAVELLRSPFVDYARFLKLPVEFAHTFSICALLSAFLLAALGARALGPALTVWTLLTLVAYGRMWLGAGRYLVSNFPMFLFAAWLLRNRPGALQTLIVVSVGLLALLFLAFSHGHWVA